MNFLQGLRSIQRPTVPTPNWTNSKKGIAKHRDYIFTFLTNTAVKPTNNDSEKALRPAKTKLKVSGCFRTEAGAQNYATVASVIQTAVKNGQNPFEVLRVIATLALA